MLQTTDRAFINGRTVEFGMDLDMSVAVIPRNMSFTSQTPVGAGMSYTSKYAVAGIYCFDMPILMDGINEKGLSVGAFYFPGYASYTKVTRRNQSKALSPIDFTNWILTQFATVEEVKAAIKNVVITGTVFKDWGDDAPPPMHYVVYDKSGKSIVIEPVDHTLKVHDNTIGTITNSPTFDWHITNLNNTINLMPCNIAKSSLGDLTLHAFGQGTGMLGLPGDFTPPSRFVRAALFSQNAVIQKTAQEGVYQCFHILNQFDIPKGSVRGESKKKVECDYTMLTTVKDPSSLKYFYRSYKNQSLECIDLSTFDQAAKEIKTMSIKSEQSVLDVSSKLHSL